MLVVPGSVRVALQAVEEGLDKVFTAAGAEWRHAGCSMCLGMNPDQLAPGERSASTSNRNFEGRQGKGGRTHLVSPQVAAATAVLGHLASPADLSDAAVRPLESEQPWKLHHAHRPGRPAAPQQRRHRPDHPGPLAEEGHPRRLRGRALRGLAQGPGLRPQPARAHRAPRSWSPAPTSAPAPRASTPCGRCRTTASRPSSRPASPTSSAATR